MEWWALAVLGMVLAAMQAVHTVGWTNSPPSATVVVSGSTDAAGVAEQDRKSLELVVSHAAATIGRLATGGD